MKNPNSFAGRAEIFHRPDALARLAKACCPNCGKDKMRIFSVTVANITTVGFTTVDLAAIDFLDLICPKCKFTVVIGRKSPLGMHLLGGTSADLVCASNHSITR